MRKRRRNTDNVVMVVSLAMMTSWAVLYFSQSGYRLLSEIIIIVGVVLLILEAVGGEKKYARTIEPEGRFHYP